MLLPFARLGRRSSDSSTRGAGASGDLALGQNDGAEQNRIVERARREFANSFTDLAKARRNWQVVAFTLVAALAVESVATARLAMTARVVPYVIRVDRAGQISSVGIAAPLGTPDSRLVASQLAAFVRTVRTVLPAAAATAEAGLLRRAYAFAGPDAAAFLNGYFGSPAHDPRVLGMRLTREVVVTSAIRVPEPSTGPSHQSGASAAQTWRLQWTETDRPLVPGDTTRMSDWEGYFTLSIAPPTTAQGIQENPLGLSITSITWTRVGTATETDPQAALGSSAGGHVP